jgi:hypothetical protein
LLNYPIEEDLITKIVIFDTPCAYSLKLAIFNLKVHKHGNFLGSDFLNFVLLYAVLFVINIFRFLFYLLGQYWVRKLRLFSVYSVYAAKVFPAS